MKPHNDSRSTFAGATAAAIEAAEDRLDRLAELFDRSAQSPDTGEVATDVR